MKLTDSMRQYFAALGKKGGTQRAKNLSHKELCKIAMMGVRKREELAAERARAAKARKPSRRTAAA